MLKIFILTIFPNLVNNLLGLSIIRRAHNKKILKIEIVNIRDFSNDKHRKVDDYIYGIKKGMLFKFEPLYKALEYSKKKCINPYIVLVSPKGKVLNNNMIKDLAKLKEIIFIAPNYEGVDERILRFINEEISIGDYVISSGELATFVIIESIIRKLTISNDSYIEDSFSLFNIPFLLENSQYTRPDKLNNPLNSYFKLKVPEFLINGNHKDIIKKNLEDALTQTIYKKPKLFLNLIKYFVIQKKGKKINYFKNFFEFLNYKEIDEILYNSIFNNIIPS
ncbi:MAG: tRNA (guanosine(37)-N1)-methyltransferase TrmD [bacterium]|jgi:tRNA (guanine37-N1)-methyltransferase